MRPGAARQRIEVERFEPPAVAFRPAGFRPFVRTDVSGLSGREVPATEVDWADLAARLGYADQSHLIRAFTRLMGHPPATYARQA